MPKVKHFDIVEPTANPFFSTKDRSGRRCIIIERWSDTGPYLSITDELGVSWPAQGSHLKVITSLAKDADA
jgi:hypothetical protein